TRSPSRDPGRRAAAHQSTSGHIPQDFLLNLAVHAHLLIVMGCPVARATPDGGLVDSARHLSNLGTSEMTPQPQRPVFIESPILKAADAQKELPTHEGADNKMVAPSEVNRLDEMRFAPRAAILVEILHGWLQEARIPPVFPHMGQISRGQRIISVQKQQPLACGRHCPLVT